MSEFSIMTTSGAYGGRADYVPPGFVKAPAGGRWGTRFVNEFWIEDETTYDEVDKVIAGEDPMDLKRQEMVADKWQIVAVLNTMDPTLWQTVIDYGNGITPPGFPVCTPAVKAAIDYAIKIPRLSKTVDLLGALFRWNEEQKDQLFINAMQLRG